MGSWSASIVISMTYKLIFLVGQTPINIAIFIATFYAMKKIYKEFTDFNYKIHELSST